MRLYKIDAVRGSRALRDLPVEKQTSEDGTL